MASDLRDKTHLIESAKRGDKRAFEQLCSEHISALRYFLVNLTGSQYDANDILQESLIKAFTKIESYRTNISFGGWLKTIARNIYIDTIRKQSSKRDIYADDYASEVFVVEVESESWQQQEIMFDSLEAAIKSLPKEYKDILNMKYFQDLSYEEISQRLNIPIGTVKTWLHRAKKELKKGL